MPDGKDFIGAQRFDGVLRHDDHVECLAKGVEALEHAAEWTTGGVV